MIEMINESGLEFTDISSEGYREYTFTSGRKLLIHEPLFLNVSKSGGHRVFDNSGISYYIQPHEGWYISWKAKTGYPNFVR